MRRTPGWSRAGTCPAIRRASGRRRPRREPRAVAIGEAFFESEKAGAELMISWLLIVLAAFDNDKDTLICN